MEVGEREGGICDQYFYHGECRCCFHRATAPVVALLRGAPHEATAKGARILANVGVYPAPIIMPTRGPFFLQPNRTLSCLRVDHVRSYIAAVGDLAPECSQA